MAHFLKLLHFADVEVDEIAFMVLIEGGNVLVYKGLHKVVHRAIPLRDGFVGGPGGKDVTNPGYDTQQLSVVVGTFLENHSSNARPAIQPKNTYVKLNCFGPSRTGTELTRTAPAAPLW